MGAAHVIPEGPGDAGRLVDVADRLMYRVKSARKGGLLIAPMDGGASIDCWERRGRLAA